ncbi:unnamed protein product [Caenorhabditis sp. 36 PRJEB53466]|nr:unnamed protein product [Caenorhabditis sp. 36 PRJEB53466]
MNCYSFFVLFVFSILAFLNAQQLHRKCGRSAMRHVAKLCADGCEIGASVNPSVYCSVGYTDEQVSEACCPNAEKEQ